MPRPCALALALLLGSPSASSVAVGQSTAPNVLYVSWNGAGDDDAAGHEARRPVALSITWCCP
jgi:hypothetical protein